MLRRCMVFVLIVTIVLTLCPITVFAAPSGTFYGGSWWDDKQGVRFSIYDRENNCTVACIDLLQQQSFETMYEDYTESFDFKIACGNKLEYLYLYEQGYNIHDIAENIIYMDNASFSYQITNYTVNSTEDSDLFNNALWPIYSNSLGDGTYTWYAPQNMRELLADFDFSICESIFNEMGYSVLGNPEYNFFGEEYTLVVEPIYWFFNRTTARGYSTQGFYLYGTATEWALFDQYYYDRNQEFYNLHVSESASTIHGTMGLLTYLAGPASMLIEKGREFTLGDGTVLEVDTSDPEIEDLYEFYGEYKDEQWHADVNLKILLSYGAEFVTPRDLTDLNIDIVNGNTLFRTNGTGMLSFYAVSSGEYEYLPSYIELAADPDAYGIKLVLETARGSDLRLETMELLCDGLPANELVPVSTYIFDEFDTPSREGTWTFNLTAYWSSGEQLYYTSGNGTFVDDGVYTFTVRFMDLPTEYPADTSADDKMPKDFVVKDFDPSGNTYTATEAPVTHTEWHYYETTPFYNKVTEEQRVIALLRNETADASMQNVYLPKIYNNVTTAKLRNGEYHTRAGYGIGVELTKEDALTAGAQDFEAGVVLFPEYDYHNYACILERDGDDLVMEMNPHSMYYDDVLYSDYSRVHFTPVWYPDGEYKIVVFLYEYWTPAGMLWDYAEYTVHINGTVYDDWYITRN